jgi:hypothetical protein
LRLDLAAGLLVDELRRGVRRQMVLDRRQWASWMTRLATAICARGSAATLDHPDSPCSNDGR